MTLIGIAQIVLYFLILLALTKPLGMYMYRVFEGEKTSLHAILQPLERLIYRLGGVREGEEQSWIQYAGSMISLSLFSFVVVYLLQRWQGHLPLNPAHLSTLQAPQNASTMTPDLAFNTAVSFMTNTNWQAYTPETTVSYLTQMAGLAWHNFTSAAAGLGVALALARAFPRSARGTGIGNFWADVIRAIVYVLLPISFFYALFLVSQGVL